MSYTKGTSKIVTKGLVYHIDIPNPLCYHIDKCYSLIGSAIGKNNNIIKNSEGKGSINFNGFDSYISLNEKFKFTTKLSIDIWIKPITNISWGSSSLKNGKGHDYQRIIDKSKGNNALNGYSLIYHPPLNMIYYIVNNGIAKDMIGYKLPTIDKWVNIIVTKNDTKYNMYINGVLVQQNTGKVNFSLENPNMRIGAYTQSQERNFKGQINNIKIYNTALNSKEVLLNYTALKGRFIN